MVQMDPVNCIHLNLSLTFRLVSEYEEQEQLYGAEGAENSQISPQSWEIERSGVTTRKHLLPDLSHKISETSSHAFDPIPMSLL